MTYTAARGRLAEAVAAFLLSREVANVSVATLKTYTADLLLFSRGSGTGALEEFTLEAIQRHFTDLQARMKPISAHRHFRTLRTFCRWCARTERLATDPMAGMMMRLPKTLPRIPDDEDVRRLLDACNHTLEGRRNRVMVGLLADSALRKEELRRLRIGDVDLAARVVTVRAGKGAKDGVTFFGEATASLLRVWLAVHPDPRPGAFLFVTALGAQLGIYGVIRILYRLSQRARLDRKIGPHALRHYAATSLLRRTGDLELVRRVLRHESLTMTLRYAVLAQRDVIAKYQHASPVDHLRTRGMTARMPAGTDGTRRP